MRNGREGEAESVDPSGVISAGPGPREMNEWLVANPHSSCSGCQRHTLTASMPAGRCAACDATFEAGRTSVLDKIELSAFRMLAGIEHDSWCYTKAHGSGMDELVDTLADLGRDGPKVRLREQRDAGREKR